MTDHAALIHDQFTRQAEPFAAFIAASASSILEAIVDAACVDGPREVLDVACGPGVVVAALAARAEQVRGIDLVPAMLAKGAQRAEDEGLANVAFDRGDVRRLPYADGRFDAVVSRYAFHHLEDPATTLAEMARVVRSGGRVVLCDVALPEAKCAAYDAAETIRDPSHTRALEHESIDALFAQAGLQIEMTQPMRLEAELEAVLAGSFPEEGGADRLRAIYRADVGHDALGMGVRLVGDELWFDYPTMLIVATKP